MQTELALRSDDPAERNEALNKIALGTARTAHLINQLLVLARTEGATADSLPFIQVDFRLMVRDVVADAYPRAREKRIDIAFDAPEGPVWLAGHPALLQEMVGNLVDNAVRYTSTDGRIVVRVLAGDAPVLEVEDNGGGITAAERELVFERFYRVVGNNESGSGIGLAIVREIAIRHGAVASVVAPENGVGSLFRVVFPPVTALHPASGRPVP